jgi:hypothetical protein
MLAWLTYGYNYFTLNKLFKSFNPLLYSLKGHLWNSEFNYVSWLGCSIKSLNLIIDEIFI